MLFGFLTALGYVIVGGLTAGIMMKREGHLETSEAFITMGLWPVFLPMVLVEAIPDALEVHHRRKKEILQLKHEHQMAQLGAAQLQLEEHNGTNES